MDGDGAGVQARPPRGFHQVKFKPPQFGAKPRESIKVFFSKFEKFITQQEVAEENKIQSLGLCLQNEAIESYDSILENDDEIEYEDSKG